MSFTMEPSKLKTEVTASDFDYESHSLNSKTRLVNILELATQALTALALVAGASVLGLSADALKTYNETHVAPAYLLPLWPDNVDLRGSLSLVACSAIVVVVSLVALGLSKSSMIRNNPTLSMATSLALPFIALITIIIPVALVYPGNSSDAHTIQSWTCRWRSVPMETRPHWGTMCAQGEVGLGLATMLVPLEIVVLVVAVAGMVVKKRVGGVVDGGRKASPALS